MCDFFELLNKTILICVDDLNLSSLEDAKNYINNSNVELVLSSENCTKNYPNTFYPSNTDLNSVIKNSIFLSSDIIEENNESQTTNNINTETQTNFYLMKNETSITEKIKDTFNNTIEINTYFERNTSLNIDTSIIDEKDSVEKVTEREKEEGAYELIYFNISEINKLLNTFIPSNEKNDSKKMSLSSKLIQNIKNGTLNQLLSQIAKKNQSIVIEDGKDIHLLSELGSNLNRKEYSSIDFGECEKLLRSEFDINETEPLILYEIEHSVDGFNIPIIEYTLFSQDGKIQLNLSLCDKMKIKYNIPVDINENEINKYDPSSEFYNDECNKYSTEDGIDMTLYDRKNDYNTKNMSLCEKDCIFIGYNTLNSKALCDCNIKSEIKYSENDINKDDLLNKIKSDKSSSNIKVTQCLNEALSSTENIKTNSGFISLLIILIAFIIVFIIFCIKGKEMLINKIDEIIFKKFSKKSNIKIKEENTNENNKIKSPQKNIRKKGKKKSKAKLKKKNVAESNQTKVVKSNINLNLEKNKNNIIDSNINSKSEIIELNNLEDIPDEENDYELNTLVYILAKKYDKRSGCEYYLSLLKSKQLFFFTFCSFNDYNSGIIKKFIFFLSFAIHYTINALFFNDYTMHQIYADEGSYNISYQMPKIILSTISSIIVLRIMLEGLILTDRNILEVKRQNTKDKALYMKTKVLKCINIKFIIFFVVNFILLIMFWFYLTCFNWIYENTQICLIENTFISFGISLFYPFIWNIIPVVLRMQSLANKNSNKSCLYFASKILQII